MKKWYNESYFNRKNWLLENFNNLNLNCDELVFLLLVDLCKESRKTITYDYLTKKLNRNIKDVDKIIASLVDKHYLSLSSNSKGLVFDFDNIFDFDPEKYEIFENNDLYEMLGQSFGKPLTPMELQKVNDLLNEFGEKSLIEAIRIAEANRKLKLSYIEVILRNGK